MVFKHVRRRNTDYHKMIFTQTNERITNEQFCCHRFRDLITFIISENDKFIAAYNLVIGEKRVKKKRGYL